MWFERFVIIVTSLHRDYLPSSWTMFHPTYVDLGVFFGTIGIFFVLFLLYSRSFPVLALNEIKTILRATGEHGVKGAPSIHHHDDHASHDHSEDRHSSDDSNEEGHDEETSDNK
jgi:hypothetical protein